MADKIVYDEAARAAQRAQLDAVLNAVPAPEATAPMSVPVQSQVDAIAEMIADLDGHVIGSAVRSTLRYTENAHRLRVPAYLVLDPTVDPCFTPPVASEAYADVSTMTGHMLPDYVLWTGPTGDDLAAFDFAAGIRDLLFMSFSSLVFMTAINIEVYGSVGAAATAALAFAIGVVQLGSPDGGGMIDREWFPFVLSPSVPAWTEAYQWWYGPLKSGHLSYCLDVIAYVGFLRVSYTHIMDSTDAARCIRQHALRSKLWTNRISNDVPFAVGDLPILDHAAVHSYSLGGAVGFFLWWISTGQASLQLLVRASTVGDVWKRVSICLAGYKALIGHPMLNGLAKILGGEMTQIADMLTTLAPQFHRTSSLSGLICGEATLAVPARYETVLAQTSVLIAGAMEANYIPGGMEYSRFLANTRVKLSGLVRFWAQFLGSVDRKAKNMTPGEFLALIAEPVAKVRAGVQAIQAGGEPEEEPAVGQRAIANV